VKLFEPAFLSIRFAITLCMNYLPFIVWVIFLYFLQMCYEISRDFLTSKLQLSPYSIQATYHKTTVFLGALAKLRRGAVSLRHVCPFSRPTVRLPGTLEANSHMPCRAHAVTLPCRAALINTCHAAPLPFSDSAVSFVKVPVVAGNIRTASPTV
jgi:hypothetical protein